MQVPVPGRYFYAAFYENSSVGRASVPASERRPGTAAHQHQPFFPAYFFVVTAIHRGKRLGREAGLLMPRGILAYALAKGDCLMVSFRPKYRDLG